MSTDSLQHGYPNIAQSDAWWARAEKVIPGGASLLAKTPSQWTKGVAPKYLKKGKGARVWDVDGQEYLDYTMGVGPVVLGYAYPAVDDAIRAQLEDGITLSLVHPLEVEVAERLHKLLPNAEMVRFSKTGADVCSAAVRLARAHTGREQVLCCGYHGWHDWYIGITARNGGVPQAVQNLTHTFPYNDLQALEKALDDSVACVIIEAVAFQKPEPGYLQAVVDLCRKNGTVVVFDEMWTGFRLAPGGVQEFFGVQPDLCVYSKAIANGMPLSAIVGRADILMHADNDVFFYTTFGGEMLSLAAAKATLDELVNKQVPAYLHKLGEQLQNGYNAIVREMGLGWSQCIGYPCRTMVTFDASAGDPLVLKALMQQEMLRQGVLFSGFHNVSYSHTEAEILHTLTAYRSALEALQEYVDSGAPEQHLRGEPLQPVFRRTDNFNLKPR